MKRKTKIWLGIATLLVLSGSILFAVAMTLCQWNFKALSTVEHEKNLHTISESFQNLSIQTDSADIVFARSEDDKCRVECYETVKMKHSVAVQNNTLQIQTVDETKWYDFIGIDFHSPTITLYLPETAYGALSIQESTGDVTLPEEFRFDSVEISVSTGDVTVGSSTSGLLKMKTSTGDICLANVTAGALELSTSTGDMTLLNVISNEAVKCNVSTGKIWAEQLECKTLATTGDTGDLELKNVLVAEECAITRSTGDVTLNGFDAAELCVKTDTGDVTGTLRSEKVFWVETSTGKVDVPKSTIGGRCEITTSTGDVRLKVEDRRE